MPETIDLDAIELRRKNRRQLFVLSPRDAVVQADGDVERLVAEVRRLQAQRLELVTAGRGLMARIDTHAWPDVADITKAESAWLSACQTPKTLTEALDDLDHGDNSWFHDPDMGSR